MDLESRLVYDGKPRNKIRIPKISPGVIIRKSIFPHFITEPIYNNEILIRPANLGVYIEDNKGTNYTGFIKGLNPQDTNIDKRFNLIIRNVNYEKRIVYLEQRVEPENNVHILVIEEAKDPNMLFGKFLSYNVFVQKVTSNLEREVKIKDYVFGRVSKVDPKHGFFRLVPISFVSEKRYQKFEGVIL